MRGKSNKIKPSILGIILGIVWGLLVVVLVAKKEKIVGEDTYYITDAYLLNNIESQNFSRFRDSAEMVREYGEPKEDTKVHYEIMACADYIDALACLKVYHDAGDKEMTDYYMGKLEAALNEMGSLTFVAREINQYYSR